jgi:phosphoribosylformylglycinamidine cyclo-ligase
LIGLASSGLHSNGYSLVRRALLEEAGYGLDEVLPRIGRRLADELLEPTAIYAPLVLELARDGLINAAAHVTGGGIPENLPRALPDELAADVALGSWPVPAVFGLVGEVAGASEEDLRAAFNLGVGMVLVVPAARADEVGARSGGFPIGVVGD